MGGLVRPVYRTVLFFLCFIGNAFGDTCNDGYVVANKIGIATFAPVYKGTCESGYTKYEFIRNNMYPIFEQNKCGVGRRSVGNGICVDLVQNECADNYFDVSTSVSTMAARYRGTCESGYQVFEQPRSAFYIVSSGEHTHCGTGYHPSADGSCVAWPTDGCAEGQYSYTDSLVTIKPLFDKTCGSGYTSYHVQERVCFNGDVRTYADTCSPLCNALDVHTFRAGNLSIPLYGTKTTKHALVFGNEDNKCYINLLPGRLKGTLNIDAEDGIYHAVD